MDVGITKSSKHSPFHLLSGTIIVMIAFGAMMFVIRPYIVGG